MPDKSAPDQGTAAGAGTRWKRPRITRTTTRTRKTSQGTWIGYTTTRRQLAWVLTGVLTLAIIVAAVLISRDDDPAVGDADFGDPLVDQPQGLTEDQLRAFGAEHTGPVYWAGPRAGTTYELTLTSGDDVFVRYLPPGVAVGADQADYLTVATYTRPGAYQALREVATGSTFTSEETASGAFVVYAAANPTSAHFSFPDTDLQVEVYDPEAGRAVDLVLDGSITLLR